ncbi:MAG: DUF4105 domain-containing protein [Saprospiraceae bacterium]|nr:DUF4105 domain-containing protein [Saprospiraceae bacterium]
MRIKTINLSYFVLMVFIFNSLKTSGNDISVTDSILSENAEISLLTFERGNDVANIWGHSGIRVRDDLKGIDIVYNYGTYDFDAPNFLMKFLRGKLDYSLSPGSYNAVSRYYTYFKRSIFEQILNLDYDEKVKLYELLLDNYKPENRYYKYDFFFDNCSTRPLSIIEKSLNGKLLLNEENNTLTFRQLLDWQIWDKHWLNFGIDLIIGSRADRDPSPFQTSFLPLKLKEKLSSALILPTGDNLNSDNNPGKKKLIKSETAVTAFEVEHSMLPEFLKPIWIFTFLFLIEILIFYFSYRSGTLRYSWYDKTWFIIALTGGLIIAFLWFFTDHIATKANWNFVVLNPLYLFLLFRLKVFRFWIANIISLGLFLILVCYNFLPQELHPAIIPIAGTLLLKSAKYGLLSKYFIRTK